MYLSIGARCHLASSAALTATALTSPRNWGAAVQLTYESLTLCASLRLLNRRQIEGGKNSSVQVVVEFANDNI